MKLPIVFLLLLHFQMAVAQQGRSYTLLEIQEAALTSNERVKNASLEERLALQKVIETRAIGLPQVSINGSFSNFLNLPVQVVDASFINPNAKKGETISFRAGTEYSASGTFQVNQLLFNGSYLVGLQVSKFYKEFASSSTEKTKEDVLFEAIQAYQMVVVAKSNKVFVDSIFKTTESLVNKQKNYFELGMMTQEDMDQLEFSLTNAKNAQRSAQIQLDNAMSFLKFIAGIKQEETIDVAETIDQILSRALVSVSEHSSLMNNLTYQLMGKQIRLNEFNLKNKRSQNLPSAGAFFQQTYNAFRNEFNFFADERWYPQTLWGIQVQIPVFSSGQRSAQIKQAAIELEKSKNAQQEFYRSLEMQQIQAKNSYQNAMNQLSLQKSNIVLAQNIYNNALIKEKIGNGNSILVAQKYNQLMVSQAQFIGSVLDVLNAKLSLDKLYHNLK